MDGRRMLFGDLGISTEDFSRQFISGMHETAQIMGLGVSPPCAGGNRTMWNAVVVGVLAKLGTSCGYDTYPWLVDLIWWSQKSQRLVLAVESEFASSIRAIEDDFQKLSVFKCPLKLLVFSAEADEVRKMAEKYLQELSQHVKGEEYLLVGFTSSGPRSLLFKIPHDGRLEHVAFCELFSSDCTST